MSQLTIEDIARLAGSSRATVSRVLNDHPSVRPSVRDRIWRVIHEHGYVPQAAARNLVNRRTHIIGVLFPRRSQDMLVNPVFTSVGLGIGQVCATQGYMPMLTLGMNDMEERKVFEMLRGRYFDGVVVIGSDMSDSVPHLLKQAHIPYTRIGYDPNVDDMQWVDIDDAGGAYQAVTHLISLGHRRIACIKASDLEVCTPGRCEGYARALREAGLPFDPALMGEGDWSYDSGYAVMQHFLELESPPTAVFSTNDMMAAGAIHSVIAHGLKVPDDVAIVGFDDFPQTHIITPPLTTIRQPSLELGRRAAEMLIDQLEGRNTGPLHVVLPTTLVVRQSCGAAARRTESTLATCEPSVES